MKVKRIICMSLIFIMLFNTIICPISLAANELGPLAIYGPGYNESLPFNWQEIEYVRYSANDQVNNYYMQTVPIKVSESGIYAISNKFGGNISSNYVISADVSVDEYGRVQRAPLPMATYVNNGEITMDLSQYNDASKKKVGVYLDKNCTYYISFVSDEGGYISINNLTESNTANLYVEYIEPKAGDVVYEVEKTSMDFSASGIEINSTPGGLIQLEKNKKWGVTSDRAVLYQEQLGLYTTQPIISGDAVTEALEGGHNAEKTVENASAFESILTYIVLALCDGFKLAINTVLGDSTISIDKILFNNYSNIRLSFFSSNRNGEDENGYLVESGMIDSVDADGNVKQGIITKYFLLFRNIAMTIYLVMFLYTGVSILLHSTGIKKEKYKSKLMDWLKGILILSLFTYVMKYTIVINDAIVEYVEEINGKIDLPVELPTMTGISGAQGVAINAVNSNAGNGDIMEITRATASKTGRLVYAMLYLFLLKQLVGFIYMYFKRLIAVTFLIIIFPLVTISYAIDKAGDGKAQAFTSWFNEFVLNVFMQAFQAVNYIMVTALIFALNVSSSVANVIFMLIALEYVAKGDEMLRGMFTKMSGGGANSVTRNLSEATKTIATMSIAKKVTNSITGLGKRYTNMTAKISKTRDKYNEHIAVKYDEKLRKNAELEEKRRRSSSNPEWVATENVENNIDKLLSDPGRYSGEEMKETADRIYVAMNDPELRAKYNAKFATLSEDEKKELKERLIRNRAINETVNGNVGVNGPLTNLEVNFNAGIILEIIRNGKKVEGLKARGIHTGFTATEEKDYALYQYLQEQKMVRTMNDGRVEVIRDSAGNEVTLETFLEQKVKERALNVKENNIVKDLQKFNGNVTGLDTTTSKGASVGNKRVNPTQNSGLSVMRESESEIQRRDALVRMAGTTGISDDVRTKRNEAARLVSRIKEYSDAVSSGRVAGCSATEMMKLAKTWRELSEFEDDGVRDILGKLADTSETNTAIKSDVTFNLEQFETMASLSVLSDKENLEGSEEEILEMYNDAVQNIVEVSSCVRRVETADGIEFEEYSADSIARKMVARAEVDDIIEKFRAEKVIDTSNFVRTGGTQEQKRTARVIQEQRIMTEREYDRMQRTSSQTFAELLQSGVETVGAGASVAASPLNIAMGGVGSGLIAGATSDKLDIGKLGTGYITGSELENSIEKLFPGTVASNGSNTVGSKMSGMIRNTGKGPTDEAINEHLKAIQTANNTARKNVDRFGERVMNDRKINDINRR